MQCPVCQTPMIAIELDEVETDYCPECQGIWLDAGELEILLEDADQTRRLLDSFRPAETTETARLCPICLKSMQKVYVEPSNKAVLIDRCLKSHGLWFDRGELMQVLQQGAFDEQGKVAKLLREMYPPEE
ncbi:MAG: zf-TFIIB domain-containing protein [Planctomycetes bacterium]|nr:zf-TFIIB domain-containing protein [Planctomycetota bacterium]